jgi:RHS repeat-associated protein
MTTNWAGTVDGSFTSLPFGDNFAVSGSDYDQYHFAQLDYDSESLTDHAQFRQYSPAQGRWMSPDPYNGSMDINYPQTFNRYSYVGNMPLSFTDPSGLAQCDREGTCKGENDKGEWWDPLDWGNLLFGWGRPSFHGSLKPRPGTSQFVTASWTGNPTLENGVYTLQVGEYGTTLKIPVGGFKYGGTLTQFLAAASAAGFYESKADYLTGIHSGKQLRSNNTFCNLHVTDVTDASSAQGPAVTGNAHYDLINPAPSGLAQCDREGTCKGENDKGEWWDPSDWGSLLFGWGRPKFSGTLKARPKLGPITGSGNGTYTMQASYSVPQYIPPNQTALLYQDLATTVDSLLADVLFRLPWDPPLRMFGTRYCGPGGAGSRLGHINGLCAVHDDCFKRHGLNFAPNLGFGSFTASQAADAKACNEDLFYGVRSGCNMETNSLDRYWPREHR